MPKLSEINLHPSDLILDLSDELIDEMEQRAVALGLPFGQLFLNLFAAYLGIPREKLAHATAIRLDPP